MDHEITDTDRLNFVLLVLNCHGTRGLANVLPREVCTDLERKDIDVAIMANRGAAERAARIRELESKRAAIEREIVALESQG